MKIIILKWLLFVTNNYTSSATQDTTAFIVPMSYTINENLTASATYGDFDGATGCSIDDTKNFEIALAITF